MGVKGLLPQLASVMERVHVAKYAGRTAGVDALGWLYKGAVACMADVVLGRDTDEYLNVCVQMIDMLRANDVTPVLVFDGAPLPAKQKENEARNRYRVKCRATARRLLQDGVLSGGPQWTDQPLHAARSTDASAGSTGPSLWAADGELRGEAYKAVKGALSVSNDMITKLIALLRRMGVQFYVAPYEADAQLAFLSKAKLIDVVISEDADCVPYGCRTILFKLGADGWGQELKRRSLGANEAFSFLGWNEEMFIQFCVLAGCDYCASVPGVGIVGAYTYVSTHRAPAKVLAALEEERKDALPADFRDSFLSAILTFRHQLIFDPRDSKMKMLNPLTLSEAILPMVDRRLLFLGNAELGSDVVASIARGEIHPATHESYAWRDAAVALRSEQQQQQHRQHQARPAVDRTSSRSLTSSETSSATTRSEVDVRECDSMSRCESRVSHDAPELHEHPQSRLYHDRSEDVLPRRTAVRYEKPRPSSSSSWAHLDSLLGSSAHILNFRSPKVSDNFKPLSSLKAPARPQLGPSGPLAHEVKEFESKPARASTKRVRNPVNRRRDERGSGFDGEVLCRVDSTRPAISSAQDDRDGDADHVSDDRGEDDRYSAPDDHSSDAGHANDERDQPAAKKTRARDQQSPDGGHWVEVSAPRLTRPTPFGCLSMVGAVGSTASNRFRREVTPTPSPSSEPAAPIAFPVPRFSLPYARASYAEAKWDRILAGELDEDVAVAASSQDSRKSNSSRGLPASGSPASEAATALSR